ncbi:cyclic nucleotide-binding/CBS domain-containing protein [Halobacteriovorax sp. DA5]|uniref:CBS domain-containing protein n=1 Tax=Halobacteriovorax sp. DA5 TaxID=2067553 RepID=UPI000CD30AF0|nr:CBS domain-containing protein [Halobacteriovorax sp. DA5]POB12704.1 CBS domain-containing protein [Halobacteriovorax sp. DA5]
MAIKDIIQKDVVIINSNATLKDAAKQMYEKHVGAIVVVDNITGKKNTPVGILTDRDIAISFGKEGKIEPYSKVSEIMTQNVVLCTPKDSIVDTIKKMQANGIKRIPVVNSRDQIVGIISSDDIIQRLGNEIHDLSQIVKLEIEKESAIQCPIDETRQVKIA